MRIVDALKERETVARLLDPANPRLETGTPAEREEARRELRRHAFIAKVVNSDRVEIPRAELEARRFGILEHVSTQDGDWYRSVSGDPDFLTRSTAYYVTAAGDPVLLERLAGPVTCRRELEEQQAARELRRTAPKPKPKWMRA